MTLTTDSLDGTSPLNGRQANQVRRTLSLLPSVIGLLGVAATVLASVLTGMTGGAQGQPFTVLAATLVALTVVTGRPYGMYVGLFILAIGAMVAGGEPTTAEVIVLLASLVFVHEVVRFSLDSRKPTRFGPGVVTGYVGRAIAVIAVLMILALAAMGLPPFTDPDRAPTAGIWIPIGLAAAGLPLFVRPLAAMADRWRILNSPTARAFVAAVLTVGVVALAIIGANARNDIGSGQPQITAAPTTAPTTLVDPVLEETAGQGRQLPSWVVVLAVIAIAVMIYFILRRPEAIFQLEEIDRRDDDNSFDFAVAATADADEQTIDIDDDALARLLGDLQLDIRSEQDPGRAIRFGYAKIEQRLGELGLNRAGAETEQEFLRRALPKLGSSGGAFTQLTGLFERARFGHDRVDESMRRQALGAIDDLVATVSARGDR